MIRVLLANYSDDEKIKLAGCFAVALTRLTEGGDCTLECTDCKYKNVCDDLFTTLEYLMTEYVDGNL